MDKKVYNYFCTNAEHRSKEKCDYCTQGRLEKETSGESLICPHPGVSTHVKLVGEKLHSLVGSKMNKQQIVSDRRDRSTQHFKKEVLPTINPKSMEGKHFNKKFGDK